MQNAIVKPKNSLYVLGIDIYGIRCMQTGIRAVLPGGGGVTPPKKSKIGGPNLRGGGPDVVELQNFKKMKDLLAENFWKNIL